MGYGVIPDLNQRWWFKINIKRTSVYLHKLCVKRIATCPLTIATFWCWGRCRNFSISRNTKKTNTYSHFFTDAGSLYSYNKVYLEWYLSAILFMTFAVNLCLHEVLRVHGSWELSQASRISRLQQHFKTVIIESKKSVFRHNNWLYSWP